MLDLALIEKCADPILTPAVVQRFVAAAGSDDPLAITIKSDGRLVLIPKPVTAQAAMEVLSEHVGRAAVRVGITQLPAGLGIADVSKLDPGLLDACDNLKMGTALFAKVARIVTRWYGYPTNRALLPQMLDDTIFAWKTGYFERVDVFRADDPGGATFFSGKPPRLEIEDRIIPEEPAAEDTKPIDPGQSAPSDMRIDLSRIGGHR